MIDDPVAKLVAIARPEPGTEPDSFIGPPSSADGVDATFGGHFLGMAAGAAAATVDNDRLLHSVHAYFLRGGRPGEPFALTVDRTRDGRSFCTREVVAFQDPGKPQFKMIASFAVAEKGAAMAAAVPDDFDSLPAPESLPTYGELMRSQDPLPLPEEWALRDYGLDIRTVAAPWAPDGPSADGGIRFWVRALPGLPPAVDPPSHNVHAAILAYQSDESLADNVAIPWGKTWGSPGVVFVSLDHAMWFHRPVDLDQWLFVDQRPVVVGNGRGLATGSVWTAGGELVATFTQEALFRLGES